MSEKVKRMKKNISFSEHEKDIYDYLDKQGNTSAFVKRLVLNHMMSKQGEVAPLTIEKTRNNSENVSKNNSGSNNQSQENSKKNTVEELENMKIAQDLPI